VINYAREIPHQTIDAVSKGRSPPFGNAAALRGVREDLPLHEQGMNIMPPHETYAVEIAGLKRDLRLFEIKPGLKIAILNILGDTELVQVSARELAKKLKDKDYDLIVTAEAKSIPLAYALSVETKKPYVVLRKTYKPYMGDALKAETLSITTGQPQILILDEKDVELIKGTKVVIVDDVISTGSTLQGMRMVLDKAGASVAAEAAIFTEGDRSQWMNIISLGHLPLFTE
jgi:adenine phosphoribosyltransferase